MSHVNHSQTGFEQEKKTSFFDKLTSTEKIWGMIGIFFLIVFLSADEPIFLPVIIFIIIWYSVSQRDTGKIRIMRLVQNHPNTTVAFLADQLDKSDKFVDNVLKMMILDDGIPIRYDTVAKTVTKIGPFPGEYKYGPTGPTSHPYGGAFTPRSTQEEEHTATPVQDTHEMEPEHTASTVHTTPLSKCMECETKLPLDAKFCNSCGVRQYS